jgi:hypothetical protein
MSNFLTAPSSVDPDAPELEEWWDDGCGECGKRQIDCDCCACIGDCTCPGGTPKLVPCSILVFDCPYCGHTIRAVDWEEHPDVCNDDPGYDPQEW